MTPCSEEAHGPWTTPNPEAATKPTDLSPKGAIVELTIGTKDIQRRLHSFPNRFPLLIQFESIKRLGPSLVDLLRQLSLATALPSGPFECSVGCVGPFPCPFHPHPCHSQSPLAFPLGVEDIQPLLQRNLSVLPRAFASKISSPPLSRPRRTSHSSMTSVAAIPQTKSNRYDWPPFPQKPHHAHGPDPTKTGWRRKKISSRQPTRTNARQGAIQSLENHARGCTGDRPQR